MKTKAKRYHDGTPIVETDFCEGPGWKVELVRTETSELALLLHEGDGINFEVRPFLFYPDYVLGPPEENEITRHVGLPRGLAPYHWVGDLLQNTDTFLGSCLDLDERHRFLLACFVLSTWVVDRLPVAPYIALVGPPGSGKSTALKVLSLVCRRGLITSDISSAAIYHACDLLKPTLCIDEAATAGQKRALFHLLRSGTTRDAIAFRAGKSYRAYCAKVVAWTEMPDDNALKSRCIIIPCKRLRAGTG